MPASPAPPPQEMIAFATFPDRTKKRDTATSARTQKRTVRSDFIYFQRQRRRAAGRTRAAPRRISPAGHVLVVWTRSPHRSRLARRVELPSGRRGGGVWDSLTRETLEQPSMRTGLLPPPIISAGTLPNVGDSSCSRSRPMRTVLENQMVSDTFAPLGGRSRCKFG